MKTTFMTLKNGKNAFSVWANPQTKEIYPAHKNPFGYNAPYVFGDEFYFKYGRNLGQTQGKKDCSKFFYSAKSMQSVGFVLVKRGEQPLW